MENRTLFYNIADVVFERFPGYSRGVVMAYGVTNGQSPEEVVALLRDAEDSVRARLSLETIAEHPQIASWRDAYRAFGAKPSEFRSSVEAMARRALRNQELPSINTLVDIGNILSLKHLVPVGGHAIDVVIEDIFLRPATGNEIFIPFGSEMAEHPLPGEIIFVEGDTVLTRRWTWRQANHTLTLPGTEAIEFNVDGLPPTTYAQVQEICQEVIELVEKYCGGRLRYEIITADNPKIKLSE